MKLPHIRKVAQNVCLGRNFAFFLRCFGGLQKCVRDTVRCHRQTLKDALGAMIDCLCEEVHDLEYEWRGSIDGLG